MISLSVFNKMIKLGPPIPAKSAECAKGMLSNGPPGTMHQIQSFHRIHRKRIQMTRTDPGFPTPEDRMTVSNTNSQINVCISDLDEKPNDSSFIGSLQTCPIVCLSLVWVGVIGLGHVMFHDVSRSMN